MKKMPARRCARCKRAETQSLKNKVFVSLTKMVGGELLCRACRELAEKP